HWIQRRRVDEIPQVVDVAVENLEGALLRRIVSQTTRAAGAAADPRHVICASHAPKHSLAGSEHVPGETHTWFKINGICLAIGPRSAGVSRKRQAIERVTCTGNDRPDQILVQ